MTRDDAHAGEARSEEEFAAWVDEIRQGVGGEMPFVWAIMRSPRVELHWTLIQDGTLDAGFRRSLRSRFSEHGEAGRDFLLRIASDGDAAGDAILTVARMCDPLLRGIPGREDVRELALQLADREQADMRSAALIALGWVGDVADIDLLSARVRGDGSADCRVSAAGALVQLLIRHPGTEARKPVERVLRDAAEHDPEPDVRDAALEALEALDE